MDRRNFLQRGLTATAVTTVVGNVFASNEKATPAALASTIQQPTFKLNYAPHDGMFGNQDQLAVRHNAGGHVAYLDGSVRLWVPPTDRQERLQNTTVDFEANDLYINTRASNSTWFKLSDPPNGYPYGWANSPR
jgi:prepilin-type processing-associated H-X9-DG protein